MRGCASGVTGRPAFRRLRPGGDFFRNRRDSEEELHEYALEDIFWVVKNGIKMTGMPAYGPTHEDETIWAIAIFLDRSRNLSVAEYKELKDRYKNKHH